MGLKSEELSLEMTLLHWLKTYGSSCCACTSQVSYMQIKGKTWLNICPRACQISCRLPVSECIHAVVAFFCSATCQTILRIGETHVKTRNVKLMFDMSSPQVIHFLLRDCHSATALQFPGGYYIMNPRVHAIAAQLDLCRSLLHFLPIRLNALRWSCGIPCGIPWHPIAKATARQTWGVSVGLAIMWLQCLGPTWAVRKMVMNSELTKPTSTNISW